MNEHKAMRFTTFIIFLSASCASLAQSTNERDLKELQAQRDMAIATAIAPINRKYLNGLEQLLRRATQGNDLDAANKIKQAIESAGLGEPLVGKWLFRSGAWSGTRDFKPDGQIDAGADGLAKWKIVGNELRIEYATGGATATFMLPIRHGKLTGKTGKGTEITAEKDAKP